MDASKVFRHADYELICAAKPIENGKFAPSLIVSKQAWPSRPREIAVKRGNYSDADEAIEAAHAQGIEWIRDYG